MKELRKNGLSECLVGEKLRENLVVGGERAE